MFLLSFFFLPFVVSTTSFLLAPNFNYSDFLFPKINLLNYRNFSERHISIIENFSRSTLFETTICNSSATEIVISNENKRFYSLSTCVQFEGQDKVKYLSYSLPSNIDVYISGFKIRMNIPYHNLYILIKDINTNKTFLSFTYMLQSYYSFDNTITYNPQISIVNSSETFLYYSQLPLQFLDFDFNPTNFDIEKLLSSFPIHISFEHNNHVLEYIYMQHYKIPSLCSCSSKIASNFSIPVATNLNITGYTSTIKNCGNFSFVPSNDFVYKSNIISKSVFKF